MLDLQQLSIIIPSSVGGTLFEVLSEATSANPHWTISTNSYDGESAVAQYRQCPPSIPVELFFFKDGSSRVKKFIVRSVVCHDGGKGLAVVEQNSHLSAFRKVISRLRKHDFKVTLSRSDIGLSDLITGNLCLNFFQRYLAAPTKADHPSDREALDIFIYAAHRFKCDVHWSKLAEVLKADYGWSAEDADWMLDRIHVGTSVLQAQSALAMQLYWLADQEYQEYKRSLQPGEMPSGVSYRSWKKARNSRKPKQSL